MRGRDLEPNNELFSRERLAGYDPAIMKTSKMLIVGAGALGQNTALNLALAGVGEVRVVDHDLFEDHNRTRSPLYPSPEEQAVLGMSKAKVVSWKLRRLMTAPDAIVRYADNWIQELGDGAFKDVAVVASCVDSQLARAYLSDKTREFGLPFIEGGFEAQHVTLTSFPGLAGFATLSSFPATSLDEAKTAPCWRCSHQDVRGTFSCRNYAARTEASGVIPAVQNAAAVLGGLQAEAMLMAIHPVLLPLQRARSFSLNIRTWQARIVKLTRDVKCPGVHRLAAREAIRLTTSPDKPIGELLEEIGQHKCSRLRLPLKTYGKLIWHAPCTKCGNTVIVHSPEWKWRMSPLCSIDNGPFSRLNGGAAGGQISYPEITVRSNTEVLRATCREVGLGPLSMFEAAANDAVFYDADSPATRFEMPGSIEELYH